MQTPKRPFAANTKIEIDETVDHVQALLRRYGGDRFRHIADYRHAKAYFLFDYAGLEISFGFPVPTTDQERRRMYRAAHLAIKAKLESIASDIESPAQAFMAHIMVGGVLLIDKARAIGLLPPP